MLKVGFYEKEITPPLGADIPGYSGPRNSTSIHDPLRAKAIALRTGEAVHECVIMIALDLLFVPDPVYDFVMEKVEKWTLVPQKNILIAATHSHTAGPIENDGEFRIIDDAWMEMTCQSAADAAIMAYQRMQDASAKYANAYMDDMVYVRDYVMKNGDIRTNPKCGDPNIVSPKGTPDTEFPCLFFMDAEGNPMGALTSLAAHHDCKAGTEISADYSGVLADKMKDRFGRHFVNILFQGFCGDVGEVDRTKPRDTSVKEPAYMWMGKKLAKKEEELFEASVPFPIDAVYAEKRVLPVHKREVSEEVIAEHRWALENVPNDWYQMDINKPENMMFKRTHAKSLIATYEHDDYYPVYIQVVRIGDMHIYAAPGEMYAEFSLYIKKHSPTKYNMLSGTALTGVYGYIPTADVYGSTSYSVALGSAPLAPDGGQQIAEMAVEIAIEIDNQIKNNL